MAGADQTLNRLWRGNRALLAAIALGGLITLFFAIRLAFRVVYWSQHQDVPLEGWMTLGYVARSYSVDREALAEAVDGRPGERATIADIAAATGRPVAEVEADLMRAIAEARSRGRTVP